MISLILSLFISCSLNLASSLLKISFDISVTVDTVIHLLQNDSETLPADQADKMKLVG